MSILNCAHLHLFCVKQKEHIFGRAAVKINETNYSKILLLLILESNIRKFVFTVTEVKITLIKNF